MSDIPSLADQVQAPALVRNLVWQEKFAKRAGLDREKLKLYLVMSKKGSFTLSFILDTLLIARLH